MLIEPRLVASQQPAVPLPLGHHEAPVLEAPSTSKTHNITIQRRWMKKRSPSPEQEKKRRHTRGGKWLPSEDILEGGRKRQIIRGVKRGHEMDSSNAHPNTKKGED